MNCPCPACVKGHYTNCYYSSIPVMQLPYVPPTPSPYHAYVAGCPCYTCSATLNRLNNLTYSRHDANLTVAMTQELAPFAEPHNPAPDFVGARGTYKVEQLGVDWDPTNDNEKGYREEVPYAEADLVGSATDLEEDGHLPCFDLDLPAHLEPSSTAGHFHLYINKVVSWEKYVNLLHAMCEAGLVSEKYVEMSVKRGQTFVRRPGVYKKPGEGDSSS